MQIFTFWILTCLIIPSNNSTVSCFSFFSIVFRRLFLLKNAGFYLKSIGMDPSDIAALENRLIGEKWIFRRMKWCFPVEKIKSRLLGVGFSLFDAYQKSVWFQNGFIAFIQKSYQRSEIPDPWKSNAIWVVERIRLIESDT